MSLSSARAGAPDVVGEEDLGADTLNAFAAMERFDPDETRTPIVEK